MLNEYCRARSAFENPPMMSREARCGEGAVVVGKPEARRASDSFGKGHERSLGSVETCVQNLRRGESEAAVRIRTHAPKRAANPFSHPHHFIGVIAGQAHEEWRDRARGAGPEE